MWLIAATLCLTRSAGRRLFGHSLGSRRKLIHGSQEAGVCEHLPGRKPKCAIKSDKLQEPDVISSGVELFEQ